MGRLTLTLIVSCTLSTGAYADALEQAFAELRSSIDAMEQRIRDEPAYQEPHGPVGGYRHLVRALMKGLEAEVLQDEDYPYFRVLDFWLREGGDNPDQRYAFTPLRGGADYRVWGNLGTAARVELQIYAGRPWDGSGRSVGYLNFEEIQVDANGNFEIWVTRERRDGNWLKNPDDATTLFARQIYSEWRNAPTGHIHIDRLGYEGARREQETSGALAARLSAAAEMFQATAGNWPAFVQKRYIEARPANSVIPPIDTYRMGGAKGRWLSSGHFDLQPDEALILAMPASAAKYQGIQLTDLWYASLESANQISSLNTAQSVRAPDGRYYYVVANEDPGYANWLDAGALSRGTYILRWDGLDGVLEKSQWPSAQRVPLAELAGHIPGFEVVSEAERERVRRERRAHLQRRANR